MATLLVTGGAGFIGSHTCKVLAAHGHVPIALDNLSYGLRGAVRYGPLVEADLGNRSALDSLYEHYKPDGVLHFAGLVNIDESMAQPARYHAVNVEQTRVLLDWMGARGIGWIVFSSTCAVYGIPDKMPVDENAPLRPGSPYGETKLAVEQLLREAERRHGIRSMALRYFNAVGSDPEGELGWAPHANARLIPRILMAAAGDIPEFSVFGDDLPTPDGTGVRDFIHVTDVAGAHLLALDALRTGAASDVLNLGTGHGYSVREVIASVEKVSGRKIPVHIGPPRPGDVPIMVADAAKIARTLAFVPKYSALDQITGDAWNWYQAHSRR
jgi:UDP-glucose-4-epimerase GalE